MNYTSAVMVKTSVTVLSFPAFLLCEFYSFFSGTSWKDQVSNSVSILYYFSLQSHVVKVVLMVRVICSHAKHRIRYLEKKWLSLAMTVSTLIFVWFRIILKSFFFNGV